MRISKRGIAFIYKMPPKKKATPLEKAQKRDTKKLAQKDKYKKVNYEALTTGVRLRDKHTAVLYNDLDRNRVFVSGNGNMPPSGNPMLYSGSMTGL